MQYAENMNAKIRDGSFYDNIHLFHLLAVVFWKIEF